MNNIFIVVAFGVAIGVSACSNGHATIHDLTPTGLQSTVMLEPAKPFDGSQAVYRGGRDPRTGLVVERR